MATPDQLRALGIVVGQRGVTAEEADAVAEFAAALKQRRGSLGQFDLDVAREALATSPAEVTARNFLATCPGKVRGVDADASQLGEPFVFAAVYGKDASTDKPLSLEAALDHVLLGFRERRPLTAPPAFRVGTYGSKHAAIRARAFPYRPACMSGPGDFTVDCVDGASGELLGYVAVDPSSGYMDDLAVLPSAQGNGIARSLVTSTAKVLAERGVPTISLHVRAANRPAIRLYAGSLGMEMGDNEFPPWYDWHGGYHLEASSAEIAAKARSPRARLQSPSVEIAAKARPPRADCNLRAEKGGASFSKPAPSLPAFVSLFADERAAFAGSYSQTGASNCGATAVSTALAALKLSEDRASPGVVARARDYSTPSLFTYLRSRSRAGCTAADLVEGAVALGGGRCVARFFPTGPQPPADLSAWLAEWLALGAAPIATINTQLDGADYWHHQAVLGVKPHAKRLLLANPAEEVAEAELARLLGSESVMLIMQHDVQQRRADESELRAMRAEPAWAELKVAEQVAAIQAGRRGDGDDGKLKIPASYTPGITLIAAAGTEAGRRLQECQVEGDDGPWARR